MKYHILNRRKDPQFIAGKHNWTYACYVNTFEQVQERLNIISGLGMEYMVIKGTELKWDVEYEEQTTIYQVEKKRTLKDV